MNIHQHGVEIKRNYISNSIIKKIKEEVNSSSEKYPIHGIRGANNKFKTIKTLSTSKKLLDLASEVLRPNPSLIRVLFFDKTAKKTGWFHGIRIRL